jgi:nucleoside-diphosphate-sugar epimerase
MSHTALIAGITGIVGNNLAHQLSSTGWQVHGLSRRPSTPIDGVTFVAADLLDPTSLRSAVASLRPSHVFIATWLRQPTEAENIRVNSAMVRNLLEAVTPENSVRHVAQEDEVFTAAARHQFGWSVHRPHTIIGYALGNAMNMGVTLAAYATICRETGRPFLFPGSATQWNSLTDMTDARLLARHIEWAATTPAARGQAFNIVNGDVFRWSWMWPRLASWFGIESAPFPGKGTPLEQQLAGTESIWHDIAKSHNLIEPNLNHLISAWHTDADLGRPIEVVTDMGKSRKLGFLDYQATDDSFFDLFTRLRQNHIIP